MNMSIPLCRPSFDEDEVEAVRRVLHSGWVVQGPEVQAFEQALAELHHVRYCVAVSSGTAALHVSFLALGVSSGDEVLVPSFAWPSAANMAIACGARPKFVDVLEHTCNIDPEDLHGRLSDARQADDGVPAVIVPVHEFGLPANMKRVLEAAEQRDMDVVEDAACALGAKHRGQPVGTWGCLGILSFHPRKAVTTGEGGAIVTDDGDLARKCRMWRNHGQAEVEGHRDFVAPGMNYRMTDIQAAIGRVQLQKLPDILAHRGKVAALYLDELQDCPGLSLPYDSEEHTWQTFMILLDRRFDRDEIIRALKDRGIGAGQASVSAHGMQLYREEFGYSWEDLPVSSVLHRYGLALPLYAGMSRDDAYEVCAAVRSVLKG